VKNLEIEQQFSANEVFVDWLKHNATRLGTVKNTDSYYDNNFSLVLKNWWFRMRNGVYELKIPISDKAEETKQFKEITDENQICLKLGINNLISKPWHGYDLLVMTITDRDRYQYGPFNIVIDRTKFDREKVPQYQIVEIEIMINDETGTIEAQRQILRFAKKFGLKSALGKIEYFIAKKHPNIFSKMIERGIIKEEFKNFEGGIN
jgi:adenylate cyclase class IV